ncbi:MAG: helix-turn-helix domain-containing protein [Planctomycetota bacterium]|jgi:transcriptional regulator with XRE-family HTH domain|nr:helix-turn-helix domain-containing protein [Planctomycetota bacterium]
MTIAQKLKDLRTARGLTQSELAKRAGIPAAQISKYEMGYNAIGVRNLGRIANVLQCALDEIDERIDTAGEKPTTERRDKHHRFIVDEILLLVIDGWHGLPAEMKVDIAAMVRAANKKNAPAKTRRV